MKFLHLAIRNAWRNKLRTTLTAGGSAFLIFVLVFMLTALTEMEAWQGAPVTHLRLAVQSSAGLANPLPIELENYLKGDEISRHAHHVGKLNWFQGVYQDPEKFFPRFACDHLVLRDLFDEMRLPDDQFRRLCEQKNGAVVGASLAVRYGFKIGSRVPLTGDIYPCNPDLEVVGIFTTPSPRDEEVLYFRWDYFDELMEGRKLVGTYWLKARTLDDIPQLKELIDGHTRNSSDPTETMTEKEFGTQFMEMMGNAKAAVFTMGTVVLLILVLMTANTMAMSARERVTEIAVLRTLGFRRRHILFLVLAEAVIVTLSGALATLGISYLLFNVVKLSPVPQFFPYYLIAPETAGIALAAAFGCGVLSALVPAVRSARRTIVDGLRQVV